MCDEIATFKMVMGGFVEQHVAYVVNGMRDDLLIGFPWLQSRGAHLDCGAGSVYFKSLV